MTGWPVVAKDQVSSLRLFVIRGCNIWHLSRKPLWGGAIPLGRVQSLESLAILWRYNLVLNLSPIPHLSLLVELSVMDHCRVACQAAGGVH